jgi:hypothetical protein
LLLLIAAAARLDYPLKQGSQPVEIGTDPILLGLQ